MFFVLGLGFLILVLFLCMGLHYTLNKYADLFGWVFAEGACGVAMLILIGAVIVAPFSGEMHIARFGAVQATLDQARINENISPFELAAIQQEAVKMNEQLARMQYWAKLKWTNWFYYQALLNLKPIK